MTNQEQFSRQALLSRIAKGVIANYDEYIDELEVPAICLSVDGFERPLNAPVLPDGAFVDELYGDFQDVKEGFGLSLCFSVMEEDCVTRVDEMPLEDLDVVYLSRLADYVEAHKGLKIGSFD